MTPISEVSANLQYSENVMNLRKSSSSILYGTGIDSFYLEKEEMGVEKYGSIAARVTYCCLPSIIKFIFL